ncbi:MAG: glutathione S-transferase, partial [Rickettsiales bacterium]|nr:glutathione S-transferase [Rickettsiales bacterium]
MYQLYYSPGACSLAIHVTLLELGVPFKANKIDLSKGENRTPEFLKLNPRGSVPVLLDGDQIIREGAAQLLYLLDKHKSPLLPASGPERATALEWLMFANATLHPVYSRGFGLMKAEYAPEMKAQLTR